MVTSTDTRLMAALKQSQANAITLYLNNKRYHWFTFGPLFRDLHLFFDEMAAGALAEIDPFGERLRMLGGDPISTPDEIRQCCSIRIADGKPAPRQMLEEALENERQVIREMRDAARQAEEDNDYGTNDLFATLVQNHEKNAWFIEEFLRRGDAMVS
ncbi:MAG TPA: DNA starvation/stationary phase protection protein [Dehalococcoidia bacterium]|jgi:starvation-inducible DNA-binding protein|nr:DNA starvation/stationary phase protection protein [Dehalococcoidia bacterium]